MHIGSSSGTIRTSDDAPASIWVGLVPMNSQITLFDWLLSDTLQRHPELQLVLSEGGIGWIPYVLERVDYSWEHQGAWTNTTIRERPSTYFRQHFHGCFISDEHGIKNLDSIGVDNVMLETDYPHSDSTWPNSLDVARAALAGLDESSIYKSDRGNCRAHCCPVSDRFEQGGPKSGLTIEMRLARSDHIATAAIGYRRADQACFMNGQESYLD